MMCVRVYVLVQVYVLMSQSSAAAVLLLPKLGALVALTIFMKASGTLSYSSTAW